MEHPYPVGTRVYKEFPSFGWFWGIITSNIRLLKTKSHSNDNNDDGGGGDDDDDDGTEYYTYYFYEVKYTDGDGETLNQDEIEEFIKYAIDEEEKERNQAKKESLSIEVPATSRSTSTTATSTNTTRSTTSTGTDTGSSPQETDDDSDAEINIEDDSSTESFLDADYDSSEEDRRKRPKRRASIRRHTETIERKRPRRSVSYNGDEADDNFDDDINIVDDSEIEDYTKVAHDENENQNNDTVLADSHDDDVGTQLIWNSPREQKLLHEYPTTSSNTTCIKIMDKVNKSIRKKMNPDRQACQTDGCKRIVISKGFCRKCLNPDRQTCQTDGCKRIVISKGFCRKCLNPDRQTCQTDGCKTIVISKGFCRKCICCLSKKQMKTNLGKQQFDAIVRPENFPYKPNDHYLENVASETIDHGNSTEINNHPPPSKVNPLDEATSTKCKAPPSQPQLVPVIQPSMQPNIAQVVTGSLPQKDDVPDHVFQHVFNSYLAEVVATTETRTKQRNIAGRIFWQNHHPLLKSMPYYQKLRRLVSSRRRSESNLMYWLYQVPYCEGLNTYSIRQPENFDHNPSDHYIENFTSETTDICVSAEIDNHPPPSEVNLLDDVTSTNCKALPSHPQLIPVSQPPLQPIVVEPQVVTVNSLPVEDDVPAHVFQHVFRSYLAEVVATTETCTKQRPVAGRIFWQNQHPLLMSMPYYRRLQQQVTSRHITESERPFWQNQLFCCEGAFTYASTYGFLGDYQSPFS